MKKVIIPAAVIAIILIAFFAVKWANNNAVTLSNLQTALQAERSTAARYKDQYGAEHAMLLETQVDARTARIRYDSLIKATAKRVGVKPKQIAGVASLTASKQYTVPFNIDSFLKTLPKRQPGDTSPRIVYLPVNCSIDINYAKYWQRSRFLFWSNGTFLQNKKWFVDVYGNDADTRIDYFKQLHIADEYGPFALSFTVGVSIPNLKPVAVVGLSYTPKFLRFKKRK